MPKGSGRKSASEWTEVLESSNKSKVVCKYCQQQISKKVERVRSHLNKCKNKGASTSKKTAEDLESMSISTSSEDEDRELEQAEHAKKRKQERRENSVPLVKNKNLDEFVIKTSVEQKEKLDKMVAKFFFGCNIAFNVAEQKTFKEMISALRPGYIAPNRKQLSDKYLPQICTEIESSLKQELEDTSVTLILDGWSNTSNDAIIASSIHTGYGVYLIDAEDAGTEKKTSEYCAEVAIRAVDHIKELYGKAVFACCTDNENKMKRMRQILSERKGIVTYGCSAHYMNLLYKDIIPTNVTKHIVELQKFFRNHHQPHGWLKEKGGSMPQIPNETRWNSYEDCLKTFISNYHLYTRIRSEHLEDFKSYSNINAILNNVALYSEAIELEKQLSVLSTSLDKMQSDRSFLTDAVVCWNNLLSNEVFENHKGAIKKRLNDALSSIHFVAYLSHPKYLEKPLSEEQENMAENWLSENHPEMLPYFLAFKIKDPEYFPSSLFKDTVIEKFSAAKWWKILKVKNEVTKKLPDSFCTFFYNLHCCPSSAASIERHFSTYGLIWSKIRNRLGLEKALQLVKVYRILRSDLNDW